MNVVSRPLEAGWVHERPVGRVLNVNGILGRDIGANTRKMLRSLKLTAKDESVEILSFWDYTL